MSNMWISVNVIRYVPMADQLAILHGKNFNVGPNAFVPAMCICRPPLLLPFYTTFSDLDLGWGHKISVKQNLLVPVFTLF